MNKDHKDHHQQQPEQLTRERVLAFRVTFDQLDTLKRAAKHKGTTVSTVIREALSKVDALLMKGRKTGGRQAGTPNKANGTLQEQVEAEAGAPLPVLLTRIAIRAMKGGDHQLAVNALSKAAAYVYPRMATADPPAPPLPSLVIRSHTGGCIMCGHAPSDPVHITREIVHRNAEVPSP